MKRFKVVLILRKTSVSETVRALNRKEAIRLALMDINENSVIRSIVVEEI